MDFFRKLFGGGAAGRQGGDRAGLYFYVSPTGCDEVVRVRIDRNNDLSLADDNTTYYVRKLVRGTTYRCNREAELELFFDRNRQLRDQKVSRGTLVTQADYEAWLAAQETSASPS